MPLKLYIKYVSPPCRAVLTVAKALGIELEIEEVDKEFMTGPKILELNPQRTIPILVDDDFVLWDSHAINGYLVHKYGKDDSLYPKDPRKKAIIDQRLHFECSVFYPRFINAVLPILQGAVTEVTDDIIIKIEDACEMLNAFLKNKVWLAGDEVTIADYSVLCTLTALEIALPIDEERYPRLFNWLQSGKELPVFKEANEIAMERTRAFIIEKFGL